ncbi:MAG: GNAT family N-acetyltransferase [Gammaproteobacteria bacterium]
MAKNARKAATDSVSGVQEMATTDASLATVPHFQKQHDHRQLQISTYPYIRSDASFVQEWDTLAEQIGASPYLRPGWVAAWWHAFGIGELEIRTLRNRGQLVAVLPMIKHRSTLKSVANCHSPRFGLLAKDLASATELARTLFEAKPRRVSIAALDPAGSSMKACWRAAEEAGYRTILHPYQRSPYLEIDESWSEYESRLSRRLLVNLRRCRQRLKKLGSVAIEIVDGHEQLDSFLEEAFAVEASGWKGAQRTAIQCSPETVKFYTDIANWAVSRGMLRIFFLRLGKHPLAMYYGLIKDGTCYLLKGGYDAAYARYSPGKMLMHSVVSYCFSAGLSSIEFHGDANQYKFRWANAVHAQKRFDAYSPSLMGKIAWAARMYGWPAAKYLVRHSIFWKGDGRHGHSSWVIHEN